MMDVIDKPPVIDGKPPELPPYLRRKGGGDGWIIFPSILPGHLESVTRTLHENCYTIHYNFMMRSLKEDPWAVRGLAHVNTREYHKWLETYEFSHGIPPHIQFGGAKESGAGDPEFFNRWVAYAKETFC